MCIIGKEEEEEEEEEAAVENVDARCWNTRIMGVINRVMLYVGVLLFTWQHVKKFDMQPFLSPQKLTESEMSRNKGVITNNFLT